MNSYFTKPDIITGVRAYVLEHYLVYQKVESILVYYIFCSDYNKILFMEIVQEKSR